MLQVNASWFICWKTIQNSKKENNCTVISSSADKDVRNLIKTDNTEHIRQTKRSILTLYWEILLNEMFFYDTNVTEMAGKSVCISKCLNIKFIHIHVLTVVFAKASNTIIIEQTLSELYVHYHSKSHFLQQFRFIWLEGKKMSIWTPGADANTESAISLSKKHAGTARV